MTTPDNERPDGHIPDTAFDDYLRRDSAVSQQYRDLGDMPVPASLDQAVLSRARAAITADKRSRLMRWSTPLALAASVVVVVSLVMLPEVQHEVATSTLPATAPQRESYAPPQLPPSESKAEREESGATDAQRLMEAPAPSQLAAPRADAELAAQEQSRTSAMRTQEATEAAAARKRAVQAPIAQPPPPPKLEVPAPAPTTAIRQSASAAPVVVPAPQDAASATRSQSGGEQSDLQDVVVTGSLRRAPSAKAGPRDTLPAASAEANFASDAASQVSERESDPSRWLIHIRELRAAGESRLADREWRRFVAKYPQFTVDAADPARARD